MSALPRFLRRRARTAPAARRLLALEVLEGRDLLSVDLRIVTYNITADARPGMETVLRAFGDQVVNGVSRPVDILALQEVDSQATDTQAIVNLLNGIYGTGTYARGNLNGSSTGAGTQGVVYRTSTVQLLSETTVSAGTGPRQPLRHQFRPVGFGTTNDFYVYNVHPKASDTTADANIRNSEAQQVRANADALGQGTNIIYLGDTNFYRSSEPGWATLTAAGNGQLFDPINQVGSWNNNAGFAAVHTQSPSTTQRFPGQITGGMDDRFDMQLVSNELTDGTGLNIVSSSYRVLGNNGTTFNQDIDSPNNTWVWSPVAGSTVTRSALLTALATITDHLPVIADYDIIGAGDTTPPTIAPANFVDNVGGGPVLVNQAVAYTLTFSEDIINTSPGTLEAVDLENAGTAAISIGTITETSAGVFTVPVTPTAAGSLNLRLRNTAVVTDVAGNALTGLPIADNTTITVNAGDTTPPTVASIDDGDADNLVPVNVAQTYTVTFSEDIINTGGGAFTAADLNNAGTATVTVGTVTETSPGVFTVPVTPTTGGTLVLRIPTGAVVTDLAGNALAVPVQDNDTVTVDAVAPTIAPANFVDNVGGGPVTVNTAVTYTLTFSEDILNGSFTAADLNNAGTAAVAIGAVTETAPGVFTVAVTPTAPGTLSLRVPSGAVVQDVAGNALAVPVQDNTTVTVNPVATVLQVSALAPTESGFEVTFNRALNPADLNLYDSAAGALGAADVTVVGPSGAVAGSLIVDPGLARVVFVATGGPLPGGAYTVTLRSAATGFKDSGGGLLDGDANGAAGGDYVAGFTAGSTARVLSLPDFARGAGQPVNVPATATGLPLRISDAAGATSAQVDVLFDGALLAIGTTGATAGPNGGTVTVTAITGGVRVSVTGLSGATGANVVVANLVASVPNSAPYASKQVVNLANVSVNGGAVPARDDDAVQVAAYLGDVVGDRTIDAFDGTRVAQLAAGLGTGFTAYQLADPVLLADASGDGTVDAFDGTRVAQKAAGLSVPSIPDVPTGVNPPAGAPDPVIFIGAAFEQDGKPADLGALVPGQAVTLPVSVFVTEPAGVSVARATAVFRFDPGLFVFQGVKAGAIASGALGGSPFQITWREVSPGVVVIEGAGARGPDLRFGQTETLFLVSLKVRRDAKPTTSALDLAATAGPARTGLIDNQGRQLLLIPAPTDSPGDDVDATVSVVKRVTRARPRR